MKTQSFRLLLPLLAAMTLVCGPRPGFAQAPSIATPPGLTLTPAQQARGQAIQQQFVKDMTALQTDKSMTTAQKTAKAKAFYQKRDVDMMGILTPQQRSQVNAQRASQTKAFQAQQQAAQAFRSAHQSELAAGSALASKLNKSLTAAQKTQINAIRNQIAAEYQSLSADKTLSNQAKQQKLLSDQQGAQTKIMAILTPPQKSDYLKMQQMQKQLMSEAKAAHPGTPGQ